MKAIERFPFLTVSILSAGLAAVFPAPGYCANGQTAGHGIRIQFTQRDPRSSVPAIIGHLGFDPEPGKKEEHNISKQVFRIYVPRSTDPGVPHGMMFFPGDYVNVGRYWTPVCEKRRLILVVAERPPTHDIGKIGLALDAVHNMRKRYSIDSDRVYVAGRGPFGNTHAGILALLYPDVFTGCLHISGVWRFWREEKVPKQRLVRGMKSSRFVLYTTGRIRRLSELKKDFAEHFGQGRFSHSTFIMWSPERGMEPPRTIEPQTDYFDKCIAFLDQPLVKAAKHTYNQAVQAEKQGKLGQALKLYEKTAVHAMGEDFGEEAGARAAKIRKQRDDEIVAARLAIEAKDYPAALRALGEVVERFGDAAGEARELLAGLRKDSKVQAVLRSARETAGKEKLEGTAGRALGSARRLLDGDLAGGYKALRDVARRYPKTRAAAEASQEADGLWADPKKRSAILSVASSRRAEGLLRLAKNFMANGVNDQARSRLEKIVKEYPGTSQATEAEKLLARLKGK